MALEHEYQWYRSMVEGLLGFGDVNEGKYVVIKGDESEWPFDTYEEALRVGYGRHGLTPFLVQKIERHPTMIFMRDFDVGKLRPIDGPPLAPGLYWVRTWGRKSFRFMEAYLEQEETGGPLLFVSMWTPPFGTPYLSKYAAGEIVAHVPISIAPPPA